MLSDVIATPVLDGLYGHTAGIGIEFLGEVWLGLLTVMPKDDRSQYDDGTYFKELRDPRYMRLRLDEKSRINGKFIMSDAVEDEIVQVDGDNVQPIVSRNQAPLIFPENYTPETLVGFGLFRSGEKNNTPPFLWDKVTGLDGDENVVLEAEEMPIIREGDMEIVIR